MARAFPVPDRLKGLALVGLMLCVLAGSDVEAKVFDCYRSLTLSEKLAESDSIVFAKFVQRHERNGAKAAKTVFEVVAVLRDPRNSLRSGTQIEYAGWTGCKPGDFALLREVHGKRKQTPTNAEWDEFDPMTQEALRYAREAPPPTPQSTERLNFFAKHLEHPDEVIASDAFKEVSEAPWEQLIALAKKFPAAKLRKWLSQSKQPHYQVRRGLYAMMLGWCGDKTDAPGLEAIIRENPEDEFRLGIDGMVCGYLLLTGADGLKVVEQSKLLVRNVPFSETHATLTALRYMWKYGEGRIPAERLRESLRLLLDQPDLAELAVMDLARWKDWTIQPRLLKLYGSGGEYSDVRTKKAIIKFMLASMRDLPEGMTAATPQDQLPLHVRRGRESLEVLRKQDPKLVEDAEKYYPPKRRDTPKPPMPARPEGCLQCLEVRFQQPVG